MRLKTKLQFACAGFLIFVLGVGPASAQTPFDLDRNASIQAGLDWVTG